VLDNLLLGACHSRLGVNYRAYLQCPQTNIIIEVKQKGVMQTSRLADV